VRGSATPLNWNSGLAMTSGSADTWTFTSMDITAPMEWKPLLDDTNWSRGANYRVSPGETADVYPHFNTMNGRVIKLVDSFHSTLLNNDRGVWAYLPPSYDENPLANYPVLYMHDGQNLFDPALAFGGNEWMVDETLNGGAETNDITLAIREIIVV